MCSFFPLVRPGCALVGPPKPPDPLDANVLSFDDNADLVFSDEVNSDVEEAVWVFSSSLASTVARMFVDVENLWNGLPWGGRKYWACLAEPVRGRSDKIAFADWGTDSWLGMRWTGLSPAEW